MQGILNRVALTAAVFALAVPAPALAQESVVGGYNETEVSDPGCGDAGGPGAGGSERCEETAVAASSSSEDTGGTGGSLPFTGLDVGLLALAGAGLVALGFGMRRLTRHPDAA